jgi:hypothetical protein
MGNVRLLMLFTHESVKKADMKLEQFSSPFSALNFALNAVVV